MDASPPPARLSSQTGEEWTLGTLMTIFRRRRALLLRPLVGMLLLAIVYSCVATRRYKATGKIQVQKDASGSFGLESRVMGRDENDVSTDSLDYNIMLQTESQILQSDALALVVLQDLHLEQTRDYFPQHGEPSAAAWIQTAVGKLEFWRKPLEPLSVPIARAPNRRYKALKIFASHLKVEPVTGTRLIEVSYSDPDPERAAAVVNRLIAELSEFTFQQRFTSTVQGSAWLNGQLAELKRQMQDLQAKAVALQRDTGMFGNDASRNVVLERLDSLNQTLAQAESNRILKEAIDRVAASGDPEMISSLSGNSSVGAVASINTSLTLIQNLRAQQASLREDLAEDSVRYGPAYPKLAELEAQLSGVERSIGDEVHRLGERAHTDYLIAAREEAGARSAFDEQKRAASKLNDSVVAYGLAKQEADSSRDIYETLLSKLKQAGVLEGIKASNITVVSVAQVPPPDYPSSPRILLVLAAAIAAGLLLGGSLVILLELTDNKVRSPEEMDLLLGIPLLGVLPSFAARPRRPLMRLSGRSGGGAAPPGSRTLAALEKQPSTFAEGLRSLRTALLLSRSGQPPQVILVTSCLEREGKTTLALNLAALFAQQGSRVLLLDADLRRPQLCEYFAGEQLTGLGKALTSTDAVRVQHPVASMPGLAVVCGAEVPPFPSELLGSARMRSLLDQWRSEYDFIVLDSPPVLPVTDAVLLSQFSNATLLVARHGHTTRQALKRSVEALTRQRGTAAFGTVLNAVARESGDFYEYFGYQGGFYADQGARV